MQARIQLSETHTHKKNTCFAEGETVCGGEMRHEIMTNKMLRAAVEESFDVTSLRPSLPTIGRVYFTTQKHSSPSIIFQLRLYTQARFLNTLPPEELFHLGGGIKIIVMMKPFNNCSYIFKASVMFS